MHILVLDAIHGGKAIHDAFSARGYTADLVDVYRGESSVDVKTALGRTYDLIVAPVHLDPDHPLLKGADVPVISHHDAVRLLLGDDVPLPMVEITGTRGKTTTAHALATLLPGRGILHTSTGTYRFPEKTRTGRSSITPGSVLAAVKMARDLPGWLIIEESLGVTGAGTLAIITSGENYAFAAGKKNAVTAKLASAKHAKQLLLAPGMQADYRGRVIHSEDAVTAHGDGCTVTLGGRSYRVHNPLMKIPAYRTSLELAAVAAVMLGLDPSPLSAFTALPGRMALSYVNNILIVDNANSGTNTATTLDAVAYARYSAKREEVTLVIGKVEGDGAVCEGFPFSQIVEVIKATRPVRVIWVGEFPDPGTTEYDFLGQFIAAHTPTLEEGCFSALSKTSHGSIVLAVKTWR